MSQQFAALRGKFGSTDFYVVSMKVGELVRSLKIPEEMDGWDSLSIDERFQRDINYRRVKEYIAPYFAADDDRFIGAFIVTVMNHDDMKFDSLETIVPSMPNYVSAKFGQDVGLLHTSGGEEFIPLDGQHRLKGLQFAIDGKDEKGKAIPGLGSNMALSEDTCTVILVRNDVEKSRKIFNKVNRYAKGTSKGDNLLTGDDDICAIFARQLVGSELIGARIVKMDSSNTLSAKSHEFTTLSTLYDISKRVIEIKTGKKPEQQKLPPQADQQLYESILREFWTTFLEFPHYASSIRDPSQNSDQIRREIREACLACKPVVMKVLAEAYLQMNRVSEGRQGITISDFVSRASDLDWTPDNRDWQNVLLIGQKIITGNSAINLAARYIAYLLGQKLEPKELDSLRDALAMNNITLPTPAV